MEPTKIVLCELLNYFVIYIYISVLAPRWSDCFACRRCRTRLPPHQGRENRFSTLLGETTSSRTERGGKFKKETRTKNRTRQHMNIWSETFLPVKDTYEQLDKPSCQ